MATPKKVLGEAARLTEHTVAAAVGFRIARALYGRWRVMRATERERLSEIAARVKESALDVRGSGDPEAAARELRDANEQLAAALIESAEADPDLDEVELTGLRADLRRELERISSADIDARRTRPAADPRG